jgi:hypothetical protein
VRILVSVRLLVLLAIIKKIFSLIGLGVLLFAIALLIIPLVGIAVGVIGKLL